MQDSRPPAHRTRRSAVLKQLNCTLSVDEEKVEATVGYPGLVYDDYDVNSSTPRLWKLMKVMESARYFSHHYPLDGGKRTFRDYAKLTDGVLTFLITSEITLTHDLYDIEVIKCPLNIKVMGGYIGGTSLNSKTEVCSVDGKLLATNTNQVVLINKSTRRPSPVPDWWKSKYAKSAESHKSLKFERVQQPGEITPSVYKVRAAYSDTDTNNHTNWASYVKFAFDALVHCSEKGEIPSYEHKSKCGVEKAEILYLGESFEGDDLEVRLWECPEDSTRIIVHVYKSDTLICQISLVFFTEPFPTLI